MSPGASRLPAGSAEAPCPSATPKGSPHDALEPRIADERIGYFTTVREEFSDDEHPTPDRFFINRWRLEKSDPSQKLSSPKQPIVFWIENTVPVEYRDAVKTGVLLWNKAFEKIGYKDAIVVRQQPDDASWDAADARYSTIRWFTGRDAAFWADGYSDANPLTGLPGNHVIERELSERIARQEVGEVNAVHDELERLHTKTVALAIALAASALLCALGVAWLLLRRNRSLEAMVQARTAQLEEVDRSRRLFFAKASHELRTPVTAMRGEAEVALLGHAPQVEALRQSLSHIHASATFLGHRIDELLGLASADDGKLQLLRQKVELGALVKAAIEEATSFARSVEVNIELNEAGVPLFLEGDARWLRQALLTIIDNGLKFSPMGDVLTIALAASGDAARIIVTDNGPGVMPDDLPRIFDAYYQSEHGRQRGGNGLGLALARWVVEQHGGAIHASTRKEGGCCIMVTLPIRITA